MKGERYILKKNPSYVAPVRMAIINEKPQKTKCWEAYAEIGMLVHGGGWDMVRDEALEN